MSAAHVGDPSQCPPGGQLQNWRSLCGVLCELPRYRPRLFERALSRLLDYLITGGGQVSVAESLDRLAVEETASGYVERRFFHIKFGKMTTLS